MLSINAFAQVQLGGNPENLLLFALSSDGETLAGNNFAGTIHLWDTATGAEKDVFISEFVMGATSALTFSPDGTLLVSGSEKRKAIVWDVATGKAKFVIEHVGANTISSISFSPDGTTLASCAAGSWGIASTFIYLWDVETGEKKSEIELKPPDFPTCSTFSPDGTTLAIGTLGEDVYLWDVNENIEIERLNFGMEAIYVKYSPDGTTLAAGSRFSAHSRQITLWDVNTRKEIGTLHGYSGSTWVAPFAFSPDGMFLAYLATPEDGYGLYLWDILNEKQKKISELRKFAGVSPDGTFYAIDGHDITTYMLHSISPEEVFMDVSAHGKLATRWSDLKLSD